MSANLSNELRSYIEHGLEAMKVPGALISVVKDGELLWAEGFGYADLENKVKMTADNILPIGSASKAFTATSAVMLAEQGKLDLDTPLVEYIAGFKLHDREASANATARDLLCHRTGMPRHDLMWIGWDDLNRKEIVTRWLRHLPASKPFRSAWQYQNHMFATVGYLVEVLTGKTWEQFVKEEIFDALGMESGSFRVKYPDETGVYAKLYSEKDGVQRHIEPLLIDAMGPAGSINATAQDMAKWMLFNMNSGKVKDKTLIGETLFAQLHEPNIPYTLLPFDFPGVYRLGYGLGWFINTFRGHKLVEHGGNVNGASALVAMLPQKNIGVTVLTNADHSMFPTAIAYYILDELLGSAGETDWVDFSVTSMEPILEAQMKQIAGMVPAKIEGKPMLHDLHEYAGTYSHPGYGDVSLFEKDGGLRMMYHSHEVELKHLHFDIFTFELQEIPLTLAIKTGTDGKVSGLEATIEFSLPPALFTRKDK